MKRGDKAIVFEQEDIYGNPVSLASLRGSKILLSFLRTASCPFCNLRVHDLMKKQDDWKDHGLSTIAVFASSASEIRKYAGKQRPPFTIIADPDESMYRQYGIGHSLAGKMLAMLRLRSIGRIMTGGYFNLESLTGTTVLPADFLIGEDGTIEMVYYGRDFGDHIALERIDNWIGDMEAGAGSWSKTNVGIN